MDDLAEWVSVARELAVELRKVPDTTRIAGLANELSLAIERAWPQKKPLREFSFSNGTRIEVMRKDGRDPTIQWKIGRVNDKERLAHGRGHGVLLSGGTGFATKAQLICDKYEIDPPLLSDLHCLQRIALTISDKPPFGDPAEARKLVKRIERLLPSSQDAAGSPADTGGCTTTIDRTGEKILNVLAELPAAVCQSLVSAPPAEQPGATIEPDATVPARTAAPVIDAEAKPAPLEQPLPPCQLTAHQSYVRAHENNSELKGATLPEVHTWLSKHDPDPDYQLPRFQTWGRYIRAVKRHRRGCPANAPRAGRAHGSSIASHDQVSDRRIPTG